MNKNIMPGGIAADRGAIIEKIITTYHCPDYEIYSDENSAIIRGVTNDHNEVKCHTLPKGTKSILAFGQVILTISLSGVSENSEGRQTAARRMLRMVYKNRTYKLGIVDVPGGYILTAMRGNDVKLQVNLKRRANGSYKATVLGRTYNLVKKNNVTYTSLYVPPIIGTSDS